jgi:hypothetical protein
MAIAGMLAWSLFAYASAAPARDLDASPRLLASSPLRPRGHVAAGNRAIVAAGIVAAAGLQRIGWSISVTERALLVRLAAILAGLATIGGATRLALARHTIADVSSRTRFGGAAPHLVVLVCLLLLALIVFVLR